MKLNEQNEHLFNIRPLILRQTSAFHVLDQAAIENEMMRHASNDPGPISMRTPGRTRLLSTLLLGQSGGILIGTMSSHSAKVVNVLVKNYNAIQSGTPGFPKANIS